MTVDVVDLFAGPGGLGEGFASLDEGRKFRIAVSVEMESSAHQTLTLRSFFRHARGDAAALRSYYDFCNDAAAPHPRNAHPLLWEKVSQEARQLQLGVARDNEALYQILDEKRLNPDRTVVIGGPPCQAYSLVGRAKNQGTAGYVAEDDERHFLYREYLKILHRVQPAAFVMENVKGILSSKVYGRRVFYDILRDLSHPGKALRRPTGQQGDGYRIMSLAAPTHFSAGMDPAGLNASDFVLRAEDYGVPQARHRVILVGVRETYSAEVVTRLPQLERQTTVRDAIAELPALRSKLSSGDSAQAWARAIQTMATSLARDAASKHLLVLKDGLHAACANLCVALNTGGLRMPRASSSPQDSAFSRWVHDPSLGVWLNHEVRSHMASDLGRYLFAAVFGEQFGRSPKGHGDFSLDGLSPNHANWTTGKFEDRFRVQLFDAPATTVTSHIAKDGHYFIHPDSRQCRSLTVREAARLQSFPDNYFFQGNRTQQYQQVGNAVPPLLAARVSSTLANIFK